MGAALLIVYLLFGIYFSMRYLDIDNMDSRDYLFFSVSSLVFWPLYASAILLYFALTGEE